MGISITKSLQQHQLEAIASINTLAEQVRLKYITDGSGQSATYISKRADALQYKNDGYPSTFATGKYPWISAEATKLGISMQTLADLVLTTASTWDTKGSQIESERQFALQQIKSATDYPTIKTAVETATSILNTL